jgi:hypothetical protein
MKIPAPTWPQVKPTGDGRPAFRTTHGSDLVLVAVLELSDAGRVEEQG